MEVLGRGIQAGRLVLQIIQALAAIPNTFYVMARRSDGTVELLMKSVSLQSQSQNTRISNRSGGAEAVQGSGVAFGWCARHRPVLRGRAAALPWASNLGHQHSEVWSGVV